MFAVKRSKALWASACLTAGLMGAGAAHGTLMIEQGPGNFQGDENVLFNPDDALQDNASTVQGRTNQTSTLVDFFGAGEDLTTPSGGQARVEAVDGAFNDLSIALNEPGSTFATLILNINADADGSVEFNVDQLIGADLVQSFMLDGGGENFFRISAIDGQRITSVSLSSDVDLQDVRQIRIGGIEDEGGNPPAEVPEPGTALLLGLGALGLAGFRRYGRA